MRVNERRRCKVLDAVISGDRNAIKEEGEKILQ